MRISTHVQWRTKTSRLELGDRDVSLKIQIRQFKIYPISSKKTKCDHGYMLRNKHYDYDEV